MSTAGPLDLHFEGEPFMPIVFLYGGLKPAAKTFPGWGQLDMVFATVLANGFKPGGLNPFFVIGPGGTTDLGLPLLPGLAGLKVTYQAAVASSLQTFALTNAVQVTFVP